MRPMTVVAGEQIVATRSAQRDRHMLASKRRKLDHRNGGGVGEWCVVRLHNCVDGARKGQIELPDVVWDAQPRRDAGCTARLVVVPVACEPERERARPSPETSGGAQDERRVESAGKEDADLHVRNELTAYGGEKCVFGLVDGRRVTRGGDRERRLRPDGLLLCAVTPSADRGAGANLDDIGDSCRRRRHVVKGGEAAQRREIEVAF